MKLPFGYNIYRTAALYIGESKILRLKRKVIVVEHKIRNDLYDCRFVGFTHSFGFGPESVEAFIDSSEHLLAAFLYRWREKYTKIADRDYIVKTFGSFFHDRYVSKEVLG